MAGNKDIPNPPPEITSVTTLLQYILDMKKAFENDLIICRWYRGQSVVRRPLLSAAMRVRKKSKFSKEKVFFLESNALLSGPSEITRELHDENNVFDWLTLLQHYGLPTRLLDWTTDAFIALYFAVHKYPKKPGELFVLNPAEMMGNGPFVPSSSSVIARCALAFTHIAVGQWARWYEKILTNEKLADLPEAKQAFPWLPNWEASTNTVDDGSIEEKQACPMSPNWEDMSEKELNDKMDEQLTRPVAVIPNAITPRLIQQKGRFTIDGGKLYTSRDEGIYRMQSEDWRNDSENKEEIKRKWRDGPPLLPPKSLKEMHAKRITDGGDPFLWSSIIPAGKKKKILKELDALGINEASIYPELEYQARHLTDQWSYKSDKLSNASHNFMVETEQLKDKPVHPNTLLRSSAERQQMLRRKQKPRK